MSISPRWSTCMRFSQESMPPPWLRVRSTRSWTDDAAGSASAHRRGKRCDARQTAPPSWPAALDLVRSGRFAWPPLSPGGAARPHLPQPMDPANRPRRSAGGTTRGVVVPHVGDRLGYVGRRDLRAGDGADLFGGLLDR